MASNAPSTASDGPIQLTGVARSTNLRDYYISEHTEPGIGPNGRRTTRGKVSHRCLACSFKNSHKSNMEYHVRAKHLPLGASTPTTIVAASNPANQSPQPSITSFFRQAPVEATPKETILRQEFNEDLYRDALIGLVTRRRLPFSFIEYEETKYLTLCGNSAVSDLLLGSRKAVTRLLIKNYSFYVESLAEALSAALTPIHLSVDLWSTPHRRSMLAICAQWVDGSFKLQKALLAMPEVKFSHSGETQAKLIVGVLEKFCIQSNLGWITGDNATSNDTCMEEISSLLSKRWEVSCNAYFTYF
jgi:hypothetical protein